MKRNIMTVAFVAAIALIAGINVYHAQKPVTLSDIAMENVEALANGEDSDWSSGHYDVNEQRTDYFYNDRIYRQSKIINCYAGGERDCKEGRYNRYLNDNGTWGEWIPI